MTVFLEGNGLFDFPVVGESYRQKQLEQIVGGVSWDGSDHGCIAVLLPEPTNTSDVNAVAVGIDGKLVGYLPRILNEQYLALIRQAGFAGETAGCNARVVGGWDRGGDDWGMLGVKLDVAWPELSVRKIG